MFLCPDPQWPWGKKRTLFLNKPSPQSWKCTKGHSETRKTRFRILFFWQFMAAPEAADPRGSVAGALDSGSERPAK